MPEVAEDEVWEGQTASYREVSPCSIPQQDVFRLDVAVHQSRQVCLGESWDVRVEPPVEEFYRPGYVAEGFP